MTLRIFLGNLIQFNSHLSREKERGERKRGEYGLSNCLTDQLLSAPPGDWIGA